MKKSNLIKIYIIVWIISEDKDIENRIKRSYWDERRLVTN